MTIDTLDQLRTALAESSSTFGPDNLVLGADVVAALADLLLCGDPHDGSVRAAVLTAADLAEPPVPLRDWMIYDVTLVGALAYILIDASNEERSCAVCYGLFTDLVTIIKWPAVSWQAYKWIQGELTGEEYPSCNASRSAISTDDTAPPSKS
jgi:hypothetical protein